MLRQFVWVTLAAILLVGCGLGSESRSKTASKDNLKQIGIALHHYHDVYNLFPPGAVYDTSDRPHHSWQAMLLSFLEDAPSLDGPPLSRQINFNIPWDDSTNETAFKREVAVYLVPEIDEKHDAAGYAFSHYAGNKQFFQKNKSLRIFNVKDGTRNTIMAGEVSQGLRAWGDPANLRDPAIGLNTGENSFGRRSGNGAHFLFADGSVHFIANGVDPSVLTAFSTPSGGEQHPDPKNLQPK
jgi:prepilin-type processing-associated H-X9-DG protein